MTPPERQLAVLIDGDNIDDNVLLSLWSKAKAKGLIVDRRVYCLEQHRARWLKVAKANNLNVMPAVPCGKNATDIALVIGALDLVHERACNAVAIVSSDRDFLPLATRLRQKGLKVYGFGPSRPKTITKDTYNSFECLRGEAHSLIEAKHKLMAVIRELGGDHADVPLSTVGEKMGGRYHFNKLSKLIKATEELTLKGTNHVRLRKAS